MPCFDRRDPALAFALALSLIVSSGGAAPASARAEGSTESPPKAGTWAAEFEIDPTFRYNIGYYGSATLAVKRHSSPNQALRLGVNFGFSEDERDGSQGSYVYDPINYPVPLDGVGTVTRHSESHTYAPFLHLIREWPVRDQVAMFGELGPSFRYSESNNHDEAIFGYSSPSRYTSEYEQVERAVAVDVALGFEWFFASRLSLGARYGGFCSYSWGSRSSTNMTMDLNGPAFSRSIEYLKTKGVEFGTNRATITLAAYF